MGNSMVMGTIAVVGWISVPVVAYCLPKFLSHIWWDASKKLRDLEVVMIPDLLKKMKAVDENRMMGRRNKQRSVLITLDDFAAEMRHAREDAEDIFDAYLEIKMFDTVQEICRCWQCLCGAVVTWSARCVRFFSADLVNDADLPSHDDYSGFRASVDESAHKLMHGLYGVVATCKSNCVRLLQWARMVNCGNSAVVSGMWIALHWPGKILSWCWHRVCGAVESIHTIWIASIIWNGSTRLLRWMRSPQDVLPVTTNVVSSDRPIPVASNAAASVSELTSETAHSDCFEDAVWDRSAPVTTTAAALDTPVPVTTGAAASEPSRVTTGVAALDSSPMTAPSESSSLYGFFYFCNNLFWSMLYWLVGKYNAACAHRDRFHDAVGIPNQDITIMFNFVFTMISRWKLKKRIEGIEQILSKVENSQHVSVLTESELSTIANKYKIQIGTDIDRKVFGLDELRDKIVKKLSKKPHRDPPCPCYSVIGIYGVSGSGKTTLARYIKDHIEEKCTELFDTIMCIHVPETFSVDNIFHEMLKDITNEHHSSISDRKKLKNKLKEALCGKCFFLILDDLRVTNRHDPQLQELMDPLSVGLNGSKILVTSQRKDATLTDSPIKMPQLDWNQYFPMFMHYALGGSRVDDAKFTVVGEKIARKLKESPIAAKIMTGRLKANLHISFWENIAKLPIYDDTQDTLWWSYQLLNPDIRRCLEYCNIFPRKTKLIKHKLTHLWIAQGFIKNNCAQGIVSSTDFLEDVAESYVHELVSCSFLEPEGTRFDFFTIHDLLHDLLDKVTGRDCFSIQNEIGWRRAGWKGDIPKCVRHLFVQNYDGELITKKILGLKNLRTLIIYIAQSSAPVEEKIIASICKRLPKLRVLAVAFSQDHDAIKEPKMFLVPESIGQLKHLRHLAFRTDTSCKVILPSTLSQIHHIELLDFGDGDLLEFSSDGLIKLRHILCQSWDNFANIGRLISLQMIPNFRVRNKQGYEVQQLRDLNKLGGSLSIYGLENVKSIEEAHEANLAGKQRITTLKLFWDVENEANMEVKEVLEGMCPPLGLETLIIYGYNGSWYPYWMVGKHQDDPKNLQQLKFYQCSQQRPPRELEAFPRLRVLLVYMCNWNALPGNMEHLTSLKKLQIAHCSNIRFLPTLPKSLEDFHLDFCDDEFMKHCETVGHEYWQKLEHIPRKTFKKPIQRSHPIVRSKWFDETPTFVMTKKVDSDEPDGMALLELWASQDSQAFEGSVQPAIMRIRT